MVAMRKVNEVRAKFEEMKKRLKEGDEDDVEAIYWSDALAWILYEDSPVNDDS